MSAVAEDWRGMFDSEYLGAWDIPEGKDATVTIVKVAAEVLKNAKGSDKKPCCSLAETDKRLVLNKTNCRAIAALYGNDTAAWVGKRVALYRTTVQVGPEVKECIRVRPSAPKEVSK